MSIINDALKKVQQNLDRQKKGSGTNPSAPRSEKKEKHSDLFEAFIIASFLGSILILSTFFIFSPKQKIPTPPILAEKTESAQEAVKDPVSLTPPAPASVPSSAAMQKPDNSRNHVSGLTLNGIVKMGEEYVALINNKIVKEGDILGERKILRIEKDQVKVFADGETVILRLGGF